jgi:succinate dehydrogenase/fumarate reductase-like Fe-S protein
MEGIRQVVWNYAVPLDSGMSIMNALDYIYHNLDPTIAYFDHAAGTLGVCARCTGRINGKAGLSARQSSWGM